MPPPSPPKNPHTTSPHLAPFLTPTFDPTAYLNSTLPPLSIPTPSQPIIPSKHATLTDLTSQTQSHLATLSALSTRLTETLTTLTDEILRSGSRLAYDVELLRGEASALGSTLTETLAAEVGAYVPGGLTSSTSLSSSTSTSPGDSAGPDAGSTQPSSPEAEAIKDPTETQVVPNQEGSPTHEPEALTRLRTLHLIRARLQSVTHLFDAALSWPLPPSATASSSSSSSAVASLISISAPASDPTLSVPSHVPASTVSAGERGEKGAEARGLAAMEKLRGEVRELLFPSADGGIGVGKGGPEGVLAAEKRVGELKELCGVWRGTGEEKVRLKFVEGLSRLVGERRREEELRGTLGPKGEDHGVEEGSAGGEMGGGKGREGGDAGKGGEGEREKGKGIFGGLRRLREEIYLE